MNKIKILLFMAFLLTFAYFLLAFIGVPVLKQKEVANPTQLKTAIINYVSNNVQTKDTVFLAKYRILGVCGNDPQFDGRTTWQEKLAEIRYNREHPYFVDLNTGFEDVYHLDKVVVTGTIFDKNFESAVTNFNNEKTKKKTYELRIEDVKKDTVYITLIESSNYKTLKDFKMVKNINNEWSPM